MKCACPKCGHQWEAPHLCMNEKGEAEIWTTQPDGWRGEEEEPNEQEQDASHQL